MEIYITKKLSDEIKEGKKEFYFEDFINKLKILLCNWRDKTNCDEIIIEHNLKIDDKPFAEPTIVLGTKDEVIEHKKMRNLNLQKLNTLKLDLIELISSEHMCADINKVNEKLDKIKEVCKKNSKEGHYAFYVPKKCFHHLKNISKIWDGDCHEKENFKIQFVESFDEFLISDFIMMPYDITDWDFTFTPKFYHALYHELFHSIVINNYRADGEQYNEGLPELYSQICIAYLSDMAYNETEELIKECQKELKNCSYNPSSSL